MPWMTPDHPLRQQPRVEASMRPRLIAVDDVAEGAGAGAAIASASMRPRLIAVDDNPANFRLLVRVGASMRPRLIAVDDRRPACAEVPRNQASMRPRLIAVDDRLFPFVTPPTSGPLQ